MNEEDAHIGRSLQPGERLSLSLPQLTVLIDSKEQHELLLIARGASGSELVHAGPDAPYSVEHYDNGQRVTLRFDRMHKDSRYTLGAYASASEMPNVLATIGEPRAHFPIHTQ